MIKMMTNSDIESKDFSNQCLKDTTFKNVALESANFQNTTFENVKFSNCNMEDVNFENVKGESLRFTHCNLRNASFKNALISMVMIKSNLSNANMTNATIQNSQFDTVVLERTNFTDTTMLNNTFTQTDVTQANFPNYKKEYQRLLEVLEIRQSYNLDDISIVKVKNVDQEKFENVRNILLIKGYSIHLEYSGLRVILSKEEVPFIVDTLESLEANYNVIKNPKDFSNADLSYQNLVGANLSGLDFSNANFKSTTLDGANLSNAVFNGTYCKDLSLNDTNLLKADIKNTTFTNTDFRNCSLKYATMKNVSIIESSFEGATVSSINLDTVSFKNCDIAEKYESEFNTSFSRGNFKNVKFENCKFVNTNFSYTQMCNVSFKNCDMSGLETARHFGNEGIVLFYLAILENVSFESCNTANLYMNEITAIDIRFNQCSVSNTKLLGDVDEIYFDKCKIEDSPQMEYDKIAFNCCKFITSL